MEKNLLGKSEKNRRRTLRNQQCRIVERISELRTKIETDSIMLPHSPHVESTVAIDDLAMKQKLLLQNPKAHDGKFFFWQS